MRISDWSSDVCSSDLPFIFFDHIGPVDFPPGIPRSMDVRPHPHIGLSTITYLFAGEMMHRDSVGSAQPIRPGEVNWMTAGRGITHSERFEQAREHRSDERRVGKACVSQGRYRGSRCHEKKKKKKE